MLIYGILNLRDDHACGVLCSDYCLFLQNIKYHMSVCLQKKKNNQGQTPRGAFDSCVTFDNRRYISVLVCFFFASMTLKVPHLFRSDSGPIPVRLRSDSGPIPVRVRSDSGPIPVRLRSDSAPIPLRFRSDSGPIPVF